MQALKTAKMLHARPAVRNCRRHQHLRVRRRTPRRGNDRLTPNMNTLNNLNIAGAPLDAVMIG